MALGGSAVSYEQGTPVMRCVWGVIDRGCAKDARIVSMRVARSDPHLLKSLHVPLETRKVRVSNVVFHKRKISKTICTSHDTLIKTVTCSHTKLVSDGCRVSTAG